jgi:predicted peptidase
MKKSFSLILLLLSVILLPAQQLKSFKGKVNDAYNFWICTPAGYNKADTAKPLVVFLHGRSLCGRDLNRVRRYGPLNAIEKHGLKLDAIVLAPQNPGSGWKPDKVMRLVEWTKRHYSIDTNRIYLIGMSLGGFGTIDVAGTYPDRFAAAMALCGGGTIKDYCGLNEIPLWILHGTADRAVGVGASQKVVNAMHACGGSRRLIWTKLKGASHGRLARIFYLPETYQWLFAHSLADSARAVDRTFSITQSTLDRSVYRELLNSEKIAVDYTRAAPAPSDPIDYAEVEREEADSTQLASNQEEGKEVQKTTQEPEKKYYKIKSGDTLGSIARRHHTTVKALCRLNNITPTTTLRIGKRIRVK